MADAAAEPTGGSPAPAGGSGGAPAAPAPQTNVGGFPSNGTGDPQQVTGTPAPAAPDPAAPPGAGAPPPVTTPEGFKLPEKWLQKPWASKIKSEEDLYNQLDNLDKAVGKKTVMPDLAKATPEEREAFYALTRPKDAGEYQFGETTDKAISDVMGQSLMKNGITATQANEVIKDYQAAEAKMIETMYAPEGMEAAMKGAFGDDWKNVTGQTFNAIKGMLSPEDQKQLNSLPNPYIALVYRAIGTAVKAYGITETNNPHVNGGSGTPAVTDMNAVRQGIRDELGALTRRPHTADQKQALITKLNDTYKGDPRAAR